jgi:hypothetical protein
MSTGSAQLTYAILEGLLTGRAAGRALHIFALSGGGGGSTSTAEGWVDGRTVNNPYRTGLKTVDRPRHRHGGPIPVGRYTILRPEPNHHGHGRWATLVPDPGNHMTGRDGFGIHGRGPHGSDGCVVPTNRAVFHLLMDALGEDGGGTLHVVSSMAGEFA